jgi:hypothetical protein
MFGPASAKAYAYPNGKRTVYRWNRASEVSVQGHEFGHNNGTKALDEGGYVLAFFVSFVSVSLFAVTDPFNFSIMISGTHEPRAAVFIVLLD